MNDAEQFVSILRRLQDHATVESVYGEPIESHGKTILPVAKVAYGFGGGYGSDSGGEAGAGPDEDRGGQGAGMGGGIGVTPTGVVEITDGNTRFVPITRVKSLGLVAVGCLLFGCLIGWKTGSRTGTATE